MRILFEDRMYLHNMRPSVNLCTLVGCLVASRIELNAEPSDQGGGFGAKDTGHFGCLLPFWFFQPTKQPTEDHRLGDGLICAHNRALVVVRLRQRLGEVKWRSVVKEPSADLLTNLLTNLRGL